MKNNLLKYSAVAVSALALAGSIAVASASAQVSASAAVSASAVGVNANTNVAASTSMKGMYMRGRMGSSTRMASSTRISSTTRDATLVQNQTQEIANIDAHSGSEITARVSALNTLSGRVSAMTEISSTQKATITNEVDNLINELTTLQTQIKSLSSSTQVGVKGGLSSSSPLRSAMDSITKAYRVYALVIPQIEILAAADRGQTLVTSLDTVSTKLQTRITADQTAGDDVTAFQASLADLNAKTADAQTQTATAITLTASLVPDNGDATVAASNAAALKTARADVQTADNDLRAATADAQSIVKGVEALGGGASISAQ
jgi:hypothetical protein